MELNSMARIAPGMGTPREFPLAWLEQTVTRFPALQSSWCNGRTVLEWTPRAVSEILCTPVSAQTSAGLSPLSAGPCGTAGLADAAEGLFWISKYLNWDDATGCCAGGVVGTEGGGETHAGGVDGLDAGTEGAGAGVEAGVAVEAGGGWVSSTDSSSGSSVKTDRASSVGSLTTRVDMGWAGVGTGTSSGAGWEIDSAGVGPRATLYLQQR